MIIKMGMCQKPGSDWTTVLSQILRYQDYLLRGELLKLKQKHIQDPEAFINQVEDKVLQYQDAGCHWNKEETLEHINNNLKKAITFLFIH